VAFPVLDTWASSPMRLKLLEHPMTT